MAANQNVTQLTQQAGTADTTSLFYAVTSGATDTGLPFSVLVASIGLTGTPTCPTAAIATNTTQIASTAFVHSYAAPLASPTFTGVPAAPTAASGTNTTQLATTAYVITSYASPPAIGSGTPAAGSFTTIGSSGLATLSSLTTSSATIAGGTINSTPIGATTPSTGKFTTLQATTGFTGTATNDNAPAGSVGEFVSSTILVGSAVSLTTATSANVTSISLTAGDWDVWGNITYSNGGSTVVSVTQGGISTTSATIPTYPNGGGSYLFPFSVTGSPISAPVGQLRLSLSATTTVYLVAQATFTTSTSAAYGFIGARRRR